MKKIGFLINPIAGMGGAVGLKGTDSENLQEAVRRGAKPVAIERAEKALSTLTDYRSKLKFYTCAGKMGSESLLKFNFSYEIVYKPSERTTALDTKNACSEFLSREVNLVLFCGGDGTAGDIYKIINRNVPMLGIPAGVKMHSAVFGLSPAATGEIVCNFTEEEMLLRDAEIMDTDEEKYRRNILDTKILGYARVPYIQKYIQTAKGIFSSEQEDVAKEDIARYVIELMESDVVYILGAGTTTEKIAHFLDLEKTLLGIDIIKNKKLLIRDASEQDILKLLEKEKKAFIVISPIGMQGFIFGRGNQQISAKVIKKVGTENIIIISTPYKLAHTKSLVIDINNDRISRKLLGYRRVITGYHQMQMKNISLHYGEEND